MLAISADKGPAVSSRIKHSTGSRNLNFITATGTDINLCTSIGTGNTAVRTVMLVNIDACTYSDATMTVMQHLRTKVQIKLHINTYIKALIKTLINA
jgi:hypothetical protein